VFDLTWVQSSPFNELATLLSLAALMGYFGLLLKQPMIVSFIVVGIVAGPSALGIVKSYTSIELLAEIGITVLLFLVGLKLDLKLIRTLGLVSLATGLGQVIFTSIVGYFIGLMLGLNPVTALYVAIALTFSSTIIIVKLLSDKREVDSLHGRIAIGFLIVQDIFVVFAMIVLSTLGVGDTLADNASSVYQISAILFYAVMMLLFVGLFIRYLATYIMSRVARSSELLVVFVIAWAVLLAAVGSYFGLSKEIGGLLAGISIASTPFREAVVARLSSLRDFMLLFFFIVLGSKLNLDLLNAQIGASLVFSLFVLIGNPVIVLIIMGAMGYRKRTSFLAGLTVAQISEFSLIFMVMGIKLGHVSTDALGLVALVGFITIATSVYMITYSNTLYLWLEPVLGIFERKIPKREITVDHQRIIDKHYDVILFGLGRYGTEIAQHLVKSGYSILGIDFNPDEIRQWQQKGYDAKCGDACDQEFIDSLSLQGVKWVLAAMPQHDLGLTHEDPRLVLIVTLKAAGFKGKVAVSAHHSKDISFLKLKGADLVFLPFHDAAERAVERMKVNEDLG